MGTMESNAPGMGLAKLSGPCPSNWLIRERLFQRLDEVSPQSAIWISGPGGSGKTTLIASYLVCRRRPTLWYHLDAGDDDLASFFMHLNMAASRLDHEATPQLTLFTPEYQSDPRAFSRMFFRQLFAQLPQSCALVFDNYQEIPAISCLHEVLAIGIAEAPSGIQFLIGSRAAPPDSYARLSANGVLSILGWDDLRLTYEETTRFISARHDATIPWQDRGEEIYDLTQGWAAGLVLMMTHMEGRRSPQRVAIPRELDQVFDYFAREILAQTEDELSSFLLETALLSRFSLETAETLTGNARASAILRDLVRRGYFTTENMGDPVTFEYHPLFESFLRQRGKEYFDPKFLTGLQRRAAEILAAEGRPGEAVTLLSEAESWDSLERLLLEQAPTLVAEGRWRTLIDWIQLLPSETRRVSPWLNYWWGMGQLPFIPAQARSVLIHAYETFKSTGDSRGRLLSWSAVVDSFVFEWGNFTPLDDWINEMDTWRAEGIELQSPELVRALNCGMFLALMSRRPDHPQMAEWAQRAWDLVVTESTLATRMKLGPHLLIYYTWWIGDLSKAAVLLDTLRPVAEGPDASPLVRTTWAAMASGFHWMNAENAAAIEIVERGLAASEDSGVHGWDVLLISQAVFASLSSGDILGGERYLSRMAELLPQDRPMDNAMYYYLAAWAAHLREEHNRALALARTAVSMAEASGSFFQPAIFRIDYGRTLFYCGEPKAARAVVIEAQRAGQAMGARTVRYLCWIALAEFAYLEGDKTGCTEALKAAMRIGREQGFRNHTWWDPKTLSCLYSHALDAGIETAYVCGLIRDRDLLPQLIEPPSDKWPWPLRIYTLGHFSVVVNDEPLRITGKAQRRPIDLLQAIVSLGGRGNSEMHLTEALWPDAEGDTAVRSLHTTLHRLRKALGANNLIEVGQGMVSLNPRCVWVDVWALERLLSEVDTAEDARLVSLGDDLLQLYQGHFLERETDPHWALSLRERLRTRFIRGLLHLGERLIEIGEIKTALLLFERGAELDPLSESLQRPLIACYALLNRCSDALGTYANLRKALEETLGITPSLETEALVDAVRQGDANHPLLERYSSCIDTAVRD